MITINLMLWLHRCQAVLKWLKLTQTYTLFLILIHLGKKEMIYIFNVFLIWGQLLCSFIPFPTIALPIYSPGLLIQNYSQVPEFWYPKEMWHIFPRVKVITILWRILATLFSPSF